MTQNKSFEELRSRQHSGLRAAPVQARSRKTVERILSEASALLVEAGWEGFNTNLLADRANCRIATVYRYFPDKISIIKTLSEAVVAQWDAELMEFGSALDEIGDLRVVWPQFVEKFLNILAANPSALAVRKAMNAMPELRELYEQDNFRLADVMSRDLKRHLPSLKQKRAKAIARVLIETTDVVIGMAIASSGSEAKPLLTELNYMQSLYIESIYGELK